MNYEIKLPLFEGPFDLLLFFIERDELDIYDIPIAKITQDFLEYLHQMEEINIELTSEFILVASTLMKIKAKMLLPREEESKEGEDMKEELVNYLLEYRKYKSVLKTLQDLERVQFKKEKRGNIHAEIKSIAKANQLDIELHNLDLYKLLKVYEQVLELEEVRNRKAKHTIVPYPYTVSGQKDYVINKLKTKEKLSFRETIEENPNKIAVIFNFLAILELLQNRLIILHLGEGFNNFWISST